MTDIPHFSLPFRYVGGKAACTEQGSLDEITDCVIAALRTPLGSRTELPEYGTSDATFQQQPVHFQSIVDQVVSHEPRALVLWDQDPIAFEELVATIVLQVSSQEETV